MPEGIELSDIEAGKTCTCGWTIKVRFDCPDKDNEGETRSWPGFCDNCGKEYVVFND